MKTILFIEDEELARQLVKLQLSSTGHDLILASDGLEGLTIASESSPDLILLDLMLPGLDGFEVLDRLRSNKETKDIPVIVLSAKTQASDKKMADRIGADAYLTKPYSKSDLLELIESHLQETVSSPQASASGRLFVFTGPRREDVSIVTAYTGKAHAREGSTTLLDLHPFSAEYAHLLNVDTIEEPISIDELLTDGDLSPLASTDETGLQAVYNIEGSGQAGEIRSEDLDRLMKAALQSSGVVLADTPLYPSDILSRAADSAERVLFVTRPTNSDLRRAQATLKMMRESNPKKSLDVVLMGSPSDSLPSEVAERVLARFPSDVPPDHPGFEKLAGQLGGMDIPE